MKGQRERDKAERHRRSRAYLERRRRLMWEENTLASADESETRRFDWRSIRLFGIYLARYKGLTILSVLLMLLYTATNLANPYLIEVAIDQFITRADLGGLALICLVLLLVNIVMWQAQYWQIWTMSWAGQQVLYLLSSDMFRHLQQLSLSFYDRTQIGRVMSRLQSDIDVLESMLSSGLLSILGSLVALVGIIGAMIAMNAWLALLSFAVLPIMFIIAAFWSRHAERSFRRTRAAISLVNATLQENISGMRVIQSLAREERNRSEFDELNAYNRDTNLEANRISSLVLPLVEVVAAIAIALVVVYGGMEVARGTLQIGVLVAFTLYINRFFDPIRELSMQYTQLQRAAVAAERIYQILSIPVEITDKPGAYELPPIRGEIEFRNVTFGYTPRYTVLRGLNLHIKPGQTVAIVGPTGAGKTTIAGLVTRFYDVQGGAVLIDGHDVRDVTQHSLRRQIGVVPQDPFLFTGTIKENIRYGRLDASDEEVMTAARAVGLHELVERLPQGYETPIRERGRNLSMGQRQLIAFARALLADPRILILDEATANIDTVTELIVQQGLQRLLQGRTAIVIAHRLSTIKSADLIVVLQQGQVVEQGKHEELLARNGVYAKLYAMGFREASGSEVGGPVGHQELEQQEEWLSPRT
ncbi:ABC transporter ATP-binding protein [Thermogemmatispora sp.]|uniref:ABC transporter ATP-binding protein n=1 Tax=Thermogemmatispora sp. TaxID=1968838 RepID=UPI001D8B8984|nr:ABC transporter ATP-binding protein [Thermogemmatispora sp.]MBX5451542.1 ABC transporter ATP-binding protein [Thermogemmatispora sp.]